MRAIRLFVDLDGTLAVFRPAARLEELYEPGYFRNLAPQENVVEAIREICWVHRDVDVYILSSVLSDSPHAREEKDLWVDQYLPEIDRDHRIYPPCGDEKRDYIPEGAGATDILLDDYTQNLLSWGQSGMAVKLLNGINHTQGVWQGSMIAYDQTPVQLTDKLLRVIDGHVVRDLRPQDVIQEDIFQHLAGDHTQREHLQSMEMELLI